MTTMKIRMNLDKWINQNKGVIEDYKEGCLLDNMIVGCKRGIAYILESYVNPNQSEYLIHFVPYKENVPASLIACWDAIPYTD